MTDNLSKSPIILLGASAGTGKTYSLAKEFVDAVNNTEIDPASIISTTFTNKAADELAERVRQGLIKAGKIEAAERVLGSYLGTVNSVCGQLLSDYAIELGRSCAQDVISDERVSSLFTIAIEPVLHKYASIIDKAAERLLILDWKRIVLDIAKHARENDIPFTALEACAEQSWAGMSKLFPPLEPGASAEQMDKALHEAIRIALSRLPVADDDTNTTADVIARLKRVERVLANGGTLVWSEWAYIAKLHAAVPSDNIMQAVRRAAERNDRHPRMRDDMKTLIESVFACAAESMQHYETYKSKHGLVDFADQEHLTLRLLEDPTLQQRLQERLKLVLIDEFQDTSPIQLALFLKLAKLVDRSVWVGDEKQAIYGFRGSDPELMQGVVQKVAGSTRNQLSRSFRSRPDLVSFTNSVFSLAFPPTGIPESNVLIETCQRDETSGQQTALHLWWLEKQGKTQDPFFAALATGVRSILRQSDQWQITESGMKGTRPLVGSDIAILCKTNGRRRLVASALAQAGIRVATERAGLLDTAECVLAVAALRYLMDKRDSLAVAEMVHVRSSGEQRKEWLAHWLAGEHEKVRAAVPELDRLDTERHRLVYLTPSEALELAIVSGGIAETVKTWGNTRQRMSNLDALRGVARSYEDQCRLRRSAATIVGLVSHISQADATESNQPANPDEQAVHVCTYHKAKGLEWPVVILGDLDLLFDPTPFGTFVESQSDSFDPWEPLKGRQIRFWPWPYHKTKAQVKLSATSRGTKEMKMRRKLDKAEAVRLLYVGMTRARDYLILSLRDTPHGSKWLDTLTDSANHKILQLPKDHGERQLTINSSSHKIFVRHVSAGHTPVEQDQTADEEISAYTTPAPKEELTKFPPLRLIASEAVTDAGIKIGTTISGIGDRLPFTGSPEMSLLGDAVHGFLAIDFEDKDTSVDLRLQKASTILERFGVKELSPESLIIAGDRLKSFIQDRYPEAKIYTEWPIIGRVDNRRSNGRIDMLLETLEGYVLIDHKSFPGRLQEWEQRAIANFGQLAVYKQFLEEATGRPVIAMFIHMPIVGSIIELKGTTSNTIVGNDCGIMDKN